MSSTELGGVRISWFGHASFLLEWKGLLVYIDPYELPDELGMADLVLITHEHFDHCANVGKLVSDSTQVLAPESCSSELDAFGLSVIGPGDVFDLDSVGVNCVHAYNVSKSFHPKGSGVGYVVDFDGFSVYHSGDTDLIPEMKDLSGRVNVALLACGGTYTMNVDEAVRAARLISPDVVIPMHYGCVVGSDVNPDVMVEALSGSNVEVRVL